MHIYSWTDIVFEEFMDDKVVTAQFDVHEQYWPEPKLYNLIIGTENIQTSIVLDFECFI